MKIYRKIIIWVNTDFFSHLKNSSKDNQQFKNYFYNVGFITFSIELYGNNNQKDGKEEMAVNCWKVLYELLYEITHYWKLDLKTQR